MAPGSPILSSPIWSWLLGRTAAFTVTFSRNFLMGLGGTRSGARSTHREPKPGCQAPRVREPDEPWVEHGFRMKLNQRNVK
jgi:hypothetical protein